MSFLWSTHIAKSDSDLGIRRMALPYVRSALADLSRAPKANVGCHLRLNHRPQFLFRADGDTGNLSRCDSLGATLVCSTRGYRSRFSADT